jgi:integrase/recombinase XerC
VTSGNAPEATDRAAEPASGNTDDPDGPLDDGAGGSADGPLPLELAAALAGYERALRAAPLAAATRAKYASRVRGYLAWLATDIDASDDELRAQALDDPAARDGAVRDWRAWAKTIARHRPATINNTLAAVDDFYTRRGLGPATARREAMPRRAPKALGHRETVRYLRAVERCESGRDTVVALLPFYAGLRVAEVVGLDLDDVALSARKGTLRVRGKGRDGGKIRDIPLTRPELRTALATWLEQRRAWPGADTSPALLLNRRGGRLSDRSARSIVTQLGEHVGLGQDPATGRDGGFGPHILRHTFATQLIRAGVDPVLIADLMGHAGLDTLRAYTQPTDDDRERALAMLTTDG